MIDFYTTGLIKYKIQWIGFNDWNHQSNLGGWVKTPWIVFPIQVSRFHNTIFGWGILDSFRVDESR